MALPSNPTVFAEAMDPADIVDFLIVLPTSGFLEIGEVVSSYTLSVLAEAVALGLTIGSGVRAPQLVNGGTAIYLWLSIAAGHQADVAFAGGGALLGIELTVVTNASPSRTKQRTFAVKVMQL